MDETMAGMQSRLEEVMQSVLCGYGDVIRACEQSMVESIKALKHGGDVEECTKVVKQTCFGHVCRMTDSIYAFQDAVEETLGEIPSSPPTVLNAASACEPEEEKLLLDEIKELEREIQKNQHSIQDSLEKSKELRKDEMLLEQVRGHLKERIEALLESSGVDVAQEAREAIALQRKTKSMLEEIEENIFAPFQTATQQERTQQKMKEYLRLAEKS
ncbi:hypothetical protein BSKO_03417 [Bryopsis sp. KO-2023]|nr:hypothetical protein BSKO_03417 [Bryopsis sp. KO-2023]